MHGGSLYSSASPQRWSTVSEALHAFANCTHSERHTLSGSTGASGPGPCSQRANLLAHCIDFHASRHAGAESSLPGRPGCGSATS